MARTRDARMTVVEHLTELRRRMVISLIAVAVAAVIVYFFSLSIIDFLVDYYRDATDGERDALVFTGPLDAFTTRLKIATYGGIVFAAPVLLWQLWRFITPGLNPNEKRYAVPFLCASIALFILGAFVALRTLEPALGFLLGQGGSELQPLLTADKYLTLVSLMILAFGIAFEFPVVLVFLLIARVITTGQLSRSRRWAVLGITIFAAVITPSQDPYSMLLMAIPMYVFYELSIIIGKILKR
ncbi:MAG: twin-arginine translocase subunit TatC [Acidimicrobiia bacterium]